MSAKPNAVVHRAVAVRERGAVPMSAKPNGGTPFAELVGEAAKIERELRELSSLAGGKLSAKAFLREAMQIAGIDAARLKTLRQGVEEAREGQAAAELHATLRRFTLAVKSANYPHPPRSMRALRHMTTPETAGQLGKLDASVFDLFAVAAQIAVEKHPDAFGEAESSDAHTSRLLELTLQRDQLLQRIGSAYGPADLLLSDWNEAGMCRAGFALSGGAVSIVPRESAAQRLVDWMAVRKDT